jgi:hypothetical protein
MLKVFLLRMVIETPCFLLLPRCRQHPGESDPQNRLEDLTQPLACFKRLVFSMAPSKKRSSTFFWDSELFWDGGNGS